MPVQPGAWRHSSFHTSGLQLVAVSPAKHRMAPSLLVPSVTGQPPQFVAIPTNVTSRSPSAQPAPRTPGQNLVLPRIRPTIDHAAGMRAAIPKKTMNKTVQPMRVSLRFDYAESG